MRRADIVPLSVPERHAWLLEKLKGPAPPLARVPMMAERAPARLRPPPGRVRPPQAAPARHPAASPSPSPPPCEGAGGYGKTTLARALCADPDIQDAFHDGILWTTLGESPGPLLGRLQDLIAILTGRAPRASAPRRQPRASSRSSSADRRMLLVIDDLWHAAHARPFLRGGPHCARLITTRNSDTLPPNARRGAVDAMQGREAVAVAPGQAPRSARTQRSPQLAARLGRMAAAPQPRPRRTARARAPRHAPLGRALMPMSNRLLDKHGLTAFDARNAAARSDAVAKTIGLSLDLLHRGRARPLRRACGLPRGCRGPDPHRRAALVRTPPALTISTRRAAPAPLQPLAPARAGADRRTIRLHDVIRTWLRGGSRASAAGPRSRPRRSLSPPVCERLPTGPEHDDGYYVPGFPSPPARGRRGTPGATLLADYAGSRAKLRHAGVTALILDYDRRARSRPATDRRRFAPLRPRDRPRPGPARRPACRPARAKVEPGSPLLRQALAPVDEAKLLLRLADADLSRWRPPPDARRPRRLGRWRWR